MRKFLSLLLLFATVGIGSVVFTIWSHKTHPIRVDTSTQDYLEAQALLKGQRAKEALAIINRYLSQIEQNGEGAVKWLSLKVEALAMERDTQSLVALYTLSANALDTNEQAALLVANHAIQSKETDCYLKLRQRWSGQEEDEASWFLLDVDCLLLEGQVSEAEMLLKSRIFEGKEDVERLVRLALLSAPEEPQEAWQYLAEAYEKAPSNPDVRLYRAQLLEEMERPDLAHIEYLAASELAPQDPYLRDRLADFYLHHRQIAKALAVWEEGIEQSPEDLTWIKVLFWSRTAFPSGQELRRKALPQGNLSGFIEYLADLPTGRFWDETRFDLLPGGAAPLLQQEIWWLRLLEALREGREEDAVGLLHCCPHSDLSWDPALELALLRLLYYRQEGTFQVKGRDDLLEAEERGEHDRIALPDLFIAMRQLAEGQPMDEKVRVLLDSEEAFAALFLAAGWHEAALTLHKMDPLPEPFPNWIAVAFTEALERNRGANQALHFAEQQPFSAPLQLVIGRLLFTLNEPALAQVALQDLAKDPSGIGSEAALLIVSHQIDQQAFDEGEETIMANPLLVEQLQGKELLARMALLKGEEERADALYHAIEAESAEAKSYLARKAFQEKEWQLAQQLTEELLLIYPESELLQQNLLKTLEAQREDELASQ